MLQNVLLFIIPGLISYSLFTCKSIAHTLLLLLYNNIILY